MTTATKSAVLRAQYEAWPYPHVPMLASVPSTHPWQLHCSWLWDRCGSGPAPARPRLWIAGCGTFQPYVFGLANPQAEILATDISERSLAIAARRCRLRRMQNVAFAACDLTDETTWPPGQFDLIECYGVLMNLPDPAATLGLLARRLTPRGVLRLMVYPQWSRARVFQIQRLAKLLSLHAGDRCHPGLLRTVVGSLPRAHPLRHAFTTYADSRNDAGIVDGFLHAGDRGFTAFQLGALVCAAALTPAYWFHRPWGQPDVMAQRLRLDNRSQSFVLDQLDLWQELRSNFVVCLRRSDAPRPAQAPEAAHPLFTADTGSLRHRLRLQRLRLFGGSVPTRTGEGPLRLRPCDARALATLDSAGPAVRTRLRQAGLLLGGEQRLDALRPHEHCAGEATALAAATALRIGSRAPNPLYAHLFAAWERAHRCPELGLPDLETQIARWSPWADPLEERPIRWGLTPYGTFQKFCRNVLEHCAGDELPAAADWSAVRLRGDAAALAQVRSFVARCPDLPARARTDAELRELWTLLFSHDQLFLHLG